MSGPAYDPNDVLFEFVRLGASVKVIAVDPASGTEVAIVGAPAAGEQALMALARRKLEFVLARRAAPPAAKPV